MILTRISHKFLLRHRKSRRGLRRAAQLDPQRAVSTPAVESLPLFATPRLAASRYGIYEKCGLRDVRRAKLSRSAGVLLLVTLFQVALFGEEGSLETIVGVDAQPLAAQAKRVAAALEYVGAPLSPDEVARLEKAYELSDAACVEAIQETLNPKVLFAVQINPESRVKVRRGPASAELFEQGWRVFLVRVHNEAGVTAPLEVESPNAALPYQRSRYEAEPEVSVSASDVRNRWLEVSLYTGQPLEERLSGLEVEYRIIELCSRDTGKREATVGFNVGQGTQDIGFRNEASVLFECVPSVDLVFDVRDVDGTAAMASFIIRDHRRRVYPVPSRRLAPDFFFHPQVYRTTGETVRLTPGTYEVEFTRGPEYFVDRREIVVPEGVKEHKESFQLRRWICPRELGWYSGDHHVHGGGCSHYESPMAGVTPEDMMRHILGEDLNVGCVLNWWPCWYFQKRFFQGRVHDLSRENHIMRYDVEVSGFPSSYAGHVCLLRLKEDDFPETTRVEEWPSWVLPVLQWGREQGGVVGFAHSGWGLRVDTKELPNYEIPPFDGIGANEYIVDVTHGAVDFIATVDTPYVWELNIWYHTLNAGYETRISGETDFPCIYGERVGLGRVYCKMPGKKAGERLDFDAYCEAIKAGRSYVSDGLSHIMDFTANGVEVGTLKSHVALASRGSVKLRARVAALLAEAPKPELKDRPYDEKPYWHIERARISETRKVRLEVVVNGEAIAQKEILADGSLRDVEFDVTIDRSSWVALRVLPSSHTNPFFLHVDGKPVRASQKSAAWCLKSVDQCWKSKKGKIRDSDLDAARAAYDFARKEYERILDECEPGT
jgi:hypothetical protein